MAQTIYEKIENKINHLSDNTIPNQNSTDNAIKINQSLSKNPLSQPSNQKSRLSEQQILEISHPNNNTSDDVPNPNSGNKHQALIQSSLNEGDDEIITLEKEDYMGGDSNMKESS